MLQTFEPRNVLVEKGNLELKSTTENQTDFANVSTFRWLLTACVSSRRPIAGLGYYEARVMASKLSTSSSFWLQGKYSEIDVTEMFGASSRSKLEPYLMHSSLHYFRDGWPQDRTSTVESPTATPVTKWHIFGAWWRDKRTVLFYLDNSYVARLYSAKPLDEKMFLYFDSEAFVAAGLPSRADLQSARKNTMRVDWVRSYRLRGS